MKKSITCPTQGGTVTAKSVTSKMGRSPLWHSRVPAAVSLNLEISDRAVRVYSVLALKTYQGNIASIGLRQLARLIGVGRMSAQRAVKELIAVGHVKIQEGASGQRAWYELTSPVFAQKQRAGAEAVVEYPRRRLVSVRATA